VVLTEYKSYAIEIPDAIGIRHEYSTVVECKVSRSDFAADQNKASRKNGTMMGNYRYYLVPSGMIAATELPDGWGLLYCHPGKITTVVKAPEQSGDAIKAQEFLIMFSLVRRAEIRGLMPDLLMDLYEYNLKSLTYSDGSPADKTAVWLNSMKEASKPSPGKEFSV